MPDLIVLAPLAVPVLALCVLWLISVLAPRARPRPPGALW